MDPEVLKKAPLFAGLEDEAASALAAAMGTIKLNRGEVLFHEGDKEDRLYVVVSGKIKLGRSGSAGRENLLAIQPTRDVGAERLAHGGVVESRGHRWSSCHEDGCRGVGLGPALADQQCDQPEQHAAGDQGEQGRGRSRRAPRGG